MQKPRYFVGRDIAPHATTGRFPPIVHPSTLKPGQFAGISTWSQSVCFILDRANTEALYKPDGWLSTSLVDAACCMVLNEWIEGKGDEDAIFGILFVPSYIWQKFTGKGAERSPFARSPQPLEAQNIVIPINKDNNHWYLVIILDAKGAVEGDPRIPLFVVLDSLAAHGPAYQNHLNELSTLIRHFLIGLAQSSKPPVNHKKTFTPRCLALRVRVASSESSIAHRLIGWTASARESTRLRPFCALLSEVVLKEAAGNGRQVQGFS